MWLQVMISGNLAMAMSTLNETSTTRKGSSSHQQFLVHIPMVIL